MDVRLARSSILLLVAAVLTSACHSSSLPGFIPASPLTKSEIQAEQAQERASGDADETDASDWEGATTFRESDIRAAFIGVDDTDEFVSYCSGIYGPTRILFQSRRQDSAVLLKSAFCFFVEDGMQCDPLETSEGWFFDDPKHPVRLLDGMQYQRAAELIAMLRRSGVRGMTPGIAELLTMSVYSIGESDGFPRFKLGDSPCSGCDLQFTARVVESDSGTQGLELVAVKNAACE